MQDARSPRPPKRETADHADKRGWEKAVHRSHRSARPMQGTGNTEQGALPPVRPEIPPVILSEERDFRRATRRRIPRNLRSDDSIATSLSLRGIFRSLRPCGPPLAQDGREYLRVGAADLPPSSPGADLSRRSPACVGEAHRAKPQGRSWKAPATPSSPGCHRHLSRPQALSHPPGRKKPEETSLSGVLINHPGSAGGI